MGSIFAPEISKTSLSQNKNNKQINNEVTMLKYQLNISTVIEPGSCVHMLRDFLHR